MFKTPIRCRLRHAAVDQSRQSRGTHESRRIVSILNMPQSEILHLGLYVEASAVAHDELQQGLRQTFGAETGRLVRYCHLYTSSLLSHMRQQQLDTVAD